MFRRVFSRTPLVAFSAIIILISFSICAQDNKPAVGSTVPDIDTFMRIGYAKWPALAEATGALYFVSELSGVSQLYRILEDGWPYQLTVIDDGISFYALSYAGDKAIIGSSIGGSEDDQLYLLDTRSGNIEKITDNPQIDHGSIYWKKDGSGFYFRANLDNPKDFKIYYHDLISGQNRKIFDLPGTNSIADLSADEKYMMVDHIRTNVSNELYWLDLQNGKFDKITPDSGEVQYDYPYIMADNEIVYLTADVNKQGLPLIAKLNMADKRLEFIDPATKWPVDELRLSKNRKYMGWLMNIDGYSDLRLWDMEKNRPLPSPPLKGVIVSLSLSDDGCALFQFNSPVMAPDIWLWDWRTPELRKITHSTYAGIDPSIFIEPVAVKYKSFDSLEIPALLYLPPNYDGQPVPFIVHIHGGPEEQFRPYFQRNFNYFLQNGYGIFAPNIRGSAGYGRDYLNLDNYKNRFNSIKDIKAGVDFLTTNKYAKPGSIGIRGASYGGFAVLAGITEYPDIFAAAVDESGIANFVTFLTNTKDYRRALRESEYGPLTDESFLQSISPINKASSIKTPLLVIHGINDSRVPISEARQIIRAVQEHGGLVDSLIFPNEGHTVTKLANRLSLYRRTVEFFDMYLKKD